MDRDLLRYYQERAQEYEYVYDKPERQVDIKTLSTFLNETFTDKNVLEIACGTGYWTQDISKTANSIVATDVNQAVLEIAKTKTYHCPINLALANVYDLKFVPGDFDSCFGGFIWSHIPKQKLDVFLNEIYNKIDHKGVVSFIDNQFVKGNSTLISNEDEYGNTFQTRILRNGTKYEVLKNYPSDKEIVEWIKPFGKEIKITRLEYYWILSFRIEKAV